MHFRSIAPALSLVLMLVAAPRADALCAGFDDLPTFGGCPDVLWLKNRQVTLGCTATNYCPNDSVGRLQMAAFMNRVGNVVAPAVLGAEESGGTLDLNLTHYLCRSAVLPARDYGRTLTGDAALSFEVTGQQDVIVSIVFSTNGGASWQAIGSNIDFRVIPRGAAGIRQHAHASTWTQYAGHPTIAREFAVRVAGPSGSTQTISGWTCQLQITAAHTPE